MRTNYPDAFLVQTYRASVNKQIAYGKQRVVADLLFQATLLLLRERIPKPTTSYLKLPKTQSKSEILKRAEASVGVITTHNTRVLQFEILPNGRYHLMITQAGIGYSH